MISERFGQQGHYNSGGAFEKLLENGTESNHPPALSYQVLGRLQYDVSKKLRFISILHQYLSELTNSHPMLYTIQMFRVPIPNRAEERNPSEIQPVALLHGLLDLKQVISPLRRQHTISNNSTPLRHYYLLCIQHTAAMTSIMASGNKKPSPHQSRNLTYQLSGRV